MARKGETKLDLQRKLETSDKQIAALKDAVVSLERKKNCMTLHVHLSYKPGERYTILAQSSVSITVRIRSTGGSTHESYV